ncbi:MAG: hypothetical protein R2911_05155 [Caldilineaceae bacterium]
MSYAGVEASEFADGYTWQVDTPRPVGVHAIPAVTTAAQTLNGNGANVLYRALCRERGLSRKRLI